MVTAGLLATQLVLGFVLLWLSTRPVWLAVTHGMLSSLLAMALVSLAMRTRIGGAR